MDFRPFFVILSFVYVQYLQIRFFDTISLLTLTMVGTHRYIMGYGLDEYIWIYQCLQVDWLHRSSLEIISKPCVHLIQRLQYFLDKFLSKENLGYFPTVFALRNYWFLSFIYFCYESLRDMIFSLELLPWFNPIEIFHPILRHILVF